MVRMGSPKPGLSPLVFSDTDHPSKAVLLLWFSLFLEIDNISGYVFTLCVQIKLRSIKVSEWLRILVIAYNLLYTMIV